MGSRGIRLVFAYDRLSREVARCQKASGTCTGSSTDEIDMTYGPDGAIETVQRGGIIHTLDQDRIGRLETVTGPEGTSTYTFDTAGQLFQMSTPAGTSTYTYYGTSGAGGSKGALESLTDPLTGQPSTYTYDGAGRAATRSDAANLLWTRTYEPETSRIDEQTIAEGNLRYARFDLDHDKAGNVTTRIQKLWDAGDDTTDQSNPPPDPGTGTWTYAYDGAGRMTSATGPDPVDVTRTSAYTYDGAGNRTSVGVSGQNTVTTTFDLQGWPLSSDGGTPQDTGNDTSYAFDAAGNLTDLDAPFIAEDLGFTYDAWGLTTGATDGQSGGGSISIGYTLDGLGRTTSRTASGITTSYAYEGLSETLAVMDDGTQTTLYASGPGGPLAEQTGTNVTFYLRDLHGDAVATMRRTGTTLLSETWFSPFGEAVSLQSSPPVIGFQSQMTDPSTGTVDMTTRAYLPSIGRFTTRDVLFGNPKHPQSLNQFTYVADNPITLDDPLGLSCRPNVEYGPVSDEGHVETEGEVSEGHGGPCEGEGYCDSDPDSEPSKPESQTPLERLFGFSPLWAEYVEDHEPGAQSQDPVLPSHVLNFVPGASETSPGWFYLGLMGELEFGRSDGTLQYRLKVDAFYDSSSLTPGADFGQPTFVVRTALGTEIRVAATTIETHDRFIPLRWSFDRPYQEHRALLELTMPAELGQPVSVSVIQTAALDSPFVISATNTLSFENRGRMGGPYGPAF